jgi:toxin ParE1/3/4
MGYRLSASAAQDLIGIYSDGAARHGEAQADAYLTNLESAFDLLAEFPAVANERPEFNPPVRIFPKRAHVIVYIIEDDGGVLILRVRHGREDWARNPVE